MLKVVQNERLPREKHFILHEWVERISWNPSNWLDNGRNFIIYNIFLLHVEPAQESIILAKMLTHGAEFSVYVNGPQKYSQNYPVLTCWERQQWNSTIRSRSFWLVPRQFVKFHWTIQINWMLFVYRQLLMSNTKHSIRDMSDTFWTCVSNKSQKVQNRKHQLTAVSILMF